MVRRAFRASTRQPVNLGQKCRKAAKRDISRAVEAAHRALYDDAARSKLTATQRGKLLYRLADLVAENAKTLAELETRDTGKIIRETSAQIAYVADYYRYYAGLADKIEGAYLPIDKPDMDVWLRREPVGVVAAIVPWNSQLFWQPLKSARRSLPAAQSSSRPRKTDRRRFWSSPGWCRRLVFLPASSI